MPYLFIFLSLSLTVHSETTQTSKLRATIETRQLAFFTPQGKAALQNYYKVKEAPKIDEKVETVFDYLEPVKQADETAETPELIRSRLVRVARAFTGIRYEMGGRIQDSGTTDCSAFTQKVYEAFGIYIPRTSPDQYTYEGAEVVDESLLPGDLVFFDGFRGKGIVSHVGVYLGDNEFINANGNVGRVQVDHLDDPMWQRKYLGARRVIKP